MASKSPVDRIRKKIEKFKESGQWKKVVHEYRALITFQPMDPDLHKQLGEALLMQSEGLAAVTEFLSAARLYEENAEYEKSIAVLKKVLKVKPSLMDIHLRLGDLYAKEGKIKEAVSHYTQVNTYFTERGAHEEALNVYRKLAELQPSNLIIQRRLAEMYEQRGLNSQAVVTYKRLRKKMAQIGLESEAVNLLQKILELDPDSSEEHFQLTKHFYQTGDIDKAAIEIKSLLTKNPHFLRGYHLLGDILAEAGDFDRALKAYLKFLAEEPEELNVLQKVIALQIKMDMNTQAVESAKKLIDRYLTAGQKEAAIKILDQFKSVESDERTYHELLAQQLSRLDLVDWLRDELPLLAVIYEKEGKNEIAEQLRAMSSEDDVRLQLQSLLPKREDDRIGRKKMIADELYSPFTSVHHEEQSTSGEYGTSGKDVSEEDAAPVPDAFGRRKKREKRRLSSDDSAAMGLNVGRTLYEMGLYHEALREFEKASQISSHQSLAFAWLGICYQALDDPEKARFYFNKITDLKVLEMVRNSGLLKK